LYANTFAGRKPTNLMTVYIYIYVLFCSCDLSIAFTQAAASSVNLQRDDVNRAQLCVGLFLNSFQWIIFIVTTTSIMLLCFIKRDNIAVIVCRHILCTPISPVRSINAVHTRHFKIIIIPDNTIRYTSYPVKRYTPTAAAFRPLLMFWLFSWYNIICNEFLLYAYTCVIYLFDIGRLFLKNIMQVLYNNIIQYIIVPLRNMLKYCVTELWFFHMTFLNKNK